MKGWSCGATHVLLTLEVTQLNITFKMQLATRATFVVAACSGSTDRPLALPARAGEFRLLRTALLM
jgi:hypothetical protein